jgi:hypothetical protein
MLEDTLDPRPPSGELVRLVEELASGRGRPAAEVGDWLLGWHDREGTWTNLRNVEHWVERSAR